MDFSELNENKMVILCVSDGVGSLFNDWQASDTTCKVFVKKFLEEVGEKLVVTVDTV